MMTQRMCVLSEPGKIEEISSFFFLQKHSLEVKQMFRIIKYFAHLKQGVIFPLFIFPFSFYCSSLFPLILSPCPQFKVPIFFYARALLQFYFKAERKDQHKLLLFSTFIFRNYRRKKKL